MGTKEIDGPEGTGDYAVSYQGMVQLLQAMHSVVEWTSDMQKVLEKMQKTKQPHWKPADKFHGDSEYKNSLHCGVMASTMMELQIGASAIFKLAEV